jgi:hypothetical protein
MSESEEHSGRRSPTTSTLAAALGLTLSPVFYVLSMGPLVLLYHSGTCPAWLVYAMDCYVYPLDFVAKSFPPSIPWLVAYCEWWRQLV